MKKTKKQFSKKALWIISYLEKRFFRAFNSLLLLNYTMTYEAKKNKAAKLAKQYYLNNYAKKGQ